MTIPTRRRNSCGTQCPVVLAIEADDATRWLIEPIQQPQEGRFPGSARTHHGDDLGNPDLDANVIDENLSRDGAGEIRGFERDKVA